MTTDTNELSLNDAMDATMHETFAAANKEAPAADDAVPAGEAPAAKPEASRQRDQSGRFAAAAPAADAAPDADASDEAQPAAAAPAAKPAPGSWPKELRDTFGTLPPQVHELLHLRRERAERVAQLLWP